jgi:predicted Zn finger-like uncharacterized protein
MIVTCPVCSTRYLVDPSALGTGRIVRCASCAHTWHQAPPVDAPRRIELAPPEPEVTPRSTGRVQLPALAPRRRRSSAPALLLFLVVLLGVAAGGLWWGREKVMAAWPATAAYYARLGVPVAGPQDGLGLQKVTQRLDIENGLPTLVIEGEVVNTSPVARDVPKVKITLRDKSKHDLRSWSIAVTDEPILPGGSVPFHTSITQPGEDVSAIVVDFDKGS